jgi:hypothetical protein
VNDAGSSALNENVAASTAGCVSDRLVLGGELSSGVPVAVTDADGDALARRSAGCVAAGFLETELLALGAGRSGVDGAPVGFGRSTSRDMYCESSRDVEPADSACRFEAPPDTDARAAYTAVPRLSTTTTATSTPRGRSPAARPSSSAVARGRR